MSSAGLWNPSARARDSNAVRSSLAKPAPLKIRMNAHAFHFGERRVERLYCAHRDDAAADFPHQEFHAAIDLGILDAMQVIVPGAVADAGAGTLKSEMMQFPYGGATGGEAAANDQQIIQGIPPIKRCPCTFRRPPEA